MKLNFERNDCGLGLASLRHLGNDIAHQTGAALTYVRRSGLFTVVGIALPGRTTSTRRIWRRQRSSRQAARG
jgi:hypothetical protein